MVNVVKVFANVMMDIVDHDVISHVSFVILCSNKEEEGNNYL